MRRPPLDRIEIDRVLRSEISRIFAPHQFRGCRLRSRVDRRRAHTAFRHGGWWRVAGRHDGPAVLPGNGFADGGETATAEQQEQAQVAMTGPSGAISLAAALSPHEHFFPRRIDLHRLAPDQDRCRPALDGSRCFLRLELRRPIAESIRRRRLHPGDRPFYLPVHLGSDSPPRGASTAWPCRIRGPCSVAESFAYQHFVPSCPGMRIRHAACDPGWAFHTASALERHSLWAGNESAANMAAITKTRMTSARYALQLDAADQKNLIELVVKSSRGLRPKVKRDPGAVASTPYEQDCSVARVTDGAAVANALATAPG